MNPKNKNKNTKTEIPEFIKRDYGSTPEAVIEKKSNSQQTREMPAGEAPVPVQMSKEECKNLCAERGIEYKDGYEKRVLSYVCSDESVDRTGDIIRQEGWDLKNFRKNPVVMFAHDYGKYPVGNSLKEHVDGETKQLKMQILFADKDINEEADKAFRMAKSGFMKAGSVGFLPRKINNDMTKKEREELGMTPWGVEFLSQELLEHTVCSVPANPNALQNSIDKGVMKKSDFKEWLKEEKLKELSDVEESEIKPFPNEHACRLKDPSNFKKFKRGKREHDGKIYSIIFAKSDEGDWEEQSYRYDKDEWSSDEAKNHCEKHGGNFEPSSGKSGCNSNDDEFERTANLVKIVQAAVKEALDKKEKEEKEKEPKQKIGAVLSKKNKEKIEQVISNSQEAVKVLTDLLNSVSQDTESSDNNSDDNNDESEDKNLSELLSILKMDDEEEEAPDTDIYEDVLKSMSDELKKI